MTERWTILKILNWTTDFFTEKDIESPRLDAELLLASTLGMDRVGLYVNFERPLNKTELKDYRHKVRRRALREPVQYILSETEFWSLPFTVNPSVLIPRPDTEVLVEEVLKKVSGPVRVLDVGTGSGIIAIALAHEIKDIQVTAMDCSQAALETARLNALRNKVETRISFLLGSLDNLPLGSFDLIVSNPPYIPSGELEKLMPEVREYEPRLALDGGMDGLASIRQLVHQAKKALQVGGSLLVEVGFDQGQTVLSLFEMAGFKNAYVRKDYAGVPRIVVGEWLD